MVAERLNLRFHLGHPSNVFEDAGVVMHQFDGCLTDASCVQHGQVVEEGFAPWLLVYACSAWNENLDRTIEAFFLVHQTDVRPDVMANHPTARSYRNSSTRLA